MAGVDRALWQKIVQDVIAQGGNFIRPWFTQLQPLSLEHGLLEIETPGPEENAYCVKYVSRLFTEAAQHATGRLVGVCFLPQAAARSQEEAELSRVVNEFLPETGEKATEESAGVRLSEDYTFDNFVAGPCNRLAHAACLAVGDSPGKAYNPLFVHGPSGLGKTHLLQAACHRVFDSLETPNVEYLSCETFVNHFIESVGRGELHDFRYRYRHVDVLVIDDIQFLADHEQSQEEFFHTFNTLYQDKKQIILSSDRSPGDTLLEERLISRFNWGLVARIDRPCYETRVAILRKKAKQRNIDLSEDVTCLIAATIDSNTRELEGAIAKVAMLAQVTDRPIDQILVQEALGCNTEFTRREISIDDIMNAVTRRFDVRLIDLQSKKRTRSIALPRQICMYLARSLTRHSLEEIGGYFGGRDHTTVLHAKKTIEALRQKDPQFQATLEKLAETVKAGQ